MSVQRSIILDHMQLLLEILILVHRLPAQIRSIYKSLTPGVLIQDLLLMVYNYNKCASMYYKVYTILDHQVNFKSHSQNTNNQLLIELQNY